MHTQWYESSQVLYKVSGWGWCVDCVGSKYFLSLLSPQTLSQIICIFLIPITWDSIFVPPKESTFLPPLLLFDFLRVERGGRSLMASAIGFSHGCNR